MTATATTGRPTYCPRCGIHPSGRPACTEAAHLTDAQVYVRAAIAGGQA